MTMNLIASLSPDPFVEIAEHACRAIDVPHERINQMAFALWDQRGRLEGNAERDWLEAERELRSAEPTHTDALDSAEWLAREIDNCPDVE